MVCTGSVGQGKGMALSTERPCEAGVGALAMGMGIDGVSEGSAHLQRIPSIPLGKPRILIGNCHTYP